MKKYFIIFIIICFFNNALAQDQITSLKFYSPKAYEWSKIYCKKLAKTVMDQGFLLELYYDTFEASLQRETHSFTINFLGIPQPPDLTSKRAILEITYETSNFTREMHKADIEEYLQVMFQDALFDKGICSDIKMSFHGDGQTIMVTMKNFKAPNFKEGNWNIVKTKATFLPPNYNVSEKRIDPIKEYGFNPDYFPSWRSNPSAGFNKKK